MDHLGVDIARGPTELTRRDFLRLGGLMAAALSLPPKYGPLIAHALATKQRPPLVWLEFQDCAGDTESLLRASKPGIDELLLEAVSLEYHETLMVPAGQAAGRALTDAVADLPGQFVCLVEGAVPSADEGVYCTVGGRTALSMAQEVCTAARAVIAVGSCASYGGLPAAAPNPTQALGVAGAVPGLTELMALPGCPVNVVNLTAALVHLLTFDELPAVDEQRRPLFAYGERNHAQCERLEHHDAGRFVEHWGDAAHRAGWCLRGMGCRGPRAYHNCPTVRWNEEISWAVAAGHGCIGCTEPDFWDAHAPFYESDRS